MTVESLQEVEGTSAPALEWRQRWHPSLSLVLAWRNLVQDRVRLLAMLAGVSFSVLLMALQIALLLGFATTASSLIDHATADFWVASPGARDVDQAGEIAARRRFIALAAPGVSSAEELVVRFLPWKRPDGGLEQIIVVGIDLERLGLQPWNLVAGSLANLKQADAVVVDKLYADKLGLSAIGDTAEINRHRARVVAFTQGIRTFTQAPYIFTSLKNAKAFAHIDDDNTTFLLVRARPGADKTSIEKALQARFTGFDVWPSERFSAQTRWYWLVSTGAGAALVLAAILGVIVGTITVAQTLYAAAMERLSEYATLRAMGAPTRYIYGIILKQALLSAVGGYAIGISSALAVIFLARDSNLALLLPVQVAIGIALITAAMCSGAAIVAIRRAVKADPAMVFK